MTLARLVLLSLLLLPGAGAAQKLGVVPDKGADAWASQLEASLCAQAECVPSASLLTKQKKLDWKKVASTGVDFLVNVEVKKQKDLTTLTLEVQAAKQGKVLGSKVVMLRGDTINAKSLETTAATVWRLTGITPKTAPPPAEVPPEKPVAEKPVAEKPPEKPVVAQADPKKPEPEEVKPAEPPKETKPEEAPPTVVTQPTTPRPSADSRPVLTLELGAAGENRSFEYAGFRSRDLRAYSMPFFSSALLAVELSPFREGALAGLSLEGSGTIAPWLQTALTAERSVPTMSARADAGLVYRLPIGGSAFTLLGRVNFHFQSFTLAEPIVGLPNAVYLGLRAGVGGELRFAERFTAFLQANALPMFSSRDLVSSAFFSRGANVGLEVRGGLVVKVAGPLSVRASVEWTRYFFVLDANLVQDTFAQGAVDQYLGGHLAARVSF